VAQNSPNRRSGDEAIDEARSSTTRRGNRKQIPSEEAADIEQLTIGATEVSIGASPEQEFFIPVHGQVRLTPPEVRVVNHSAFQRLADVYQLGQVHYVFRGATHRRIEHALGTLYVAQLIIEHLDLNHRTMTRVSGANWQNDLSLTVAERCMIRLAALLHDVGHIPAGHTLEDELGLLPHHDELRRLELVLDRPAWHGTAEETLRSVINSAYGRELRAAGIIDSPVAVFLSITAKDPPRLSDPNALRVSVCRDVVGNTICADLIDYIHRDWHHLGKPRFFDKRLIEYMELRKGSNEETEPPRSQIVVNLRNSEQVRSDAITGILDLLESRYQLGEVALYHRTKLCAAAMLERAVAEIAEYAGDRRSIWIDALVEASLELTDEQMLEHLSSLATHASDAAAKGPARHLKAAADITRNLRVRHLYKQLYVSPASHLGKHASEVQRLYGLGGAKNRLAVLRRLERDFDLPVGSLAMYCPPSSMNPKIAEVQILVDDTVISLDSHEQREPDAGLTGGHLKAQKRRFERLWRVLIAARPDVLAAIKAKKMYPVLVRAIDSLVLGKCPAGVTLAEQSESIAHELGALRGLTVAVGGIAARGAQFEEPYPTGAPALSSFFVATRSEPAAPPETTAK
jgi:HD superfamily phosphohydrolase